MTKLPPKFCVVVLKSPVKFGWMVLAESLTFPPLLPGPDSHCQAGVRINLKVYIGTSTILLS